jgi:hypothetical protein
MYAALATIATHTNRSTVRLTHAAVPRPRNFIVASSSLGMELLYRNYYELISSGIAGEFRMQQRALLRTGRLPKTAWGRDALG